MAKEAESGMIVRGWQPPQKARRIGYRWLLLFLPLLLCLLLLRPRTGSVPAAATAFSVAQTQSESPPSSRLPQRVLQGLPTGEPSYRIVMQHQRLLSGRMMLLDADHPLPGDAQLPGVFGLLKQTSGRISCRDQQAVLAADALHALDELFRAARLAHFNQMVVFAAARSADQQLQLLLDSMARLSRSMSLETALAAARAEVEEPGCSEHQLPWCVDIRLCQGWNTLPSSRPLTESPAGQWLLDNCWAYGFIRRYPGAAAKDSSHRPWHFRYVGKAHALLMRQLGLSLEDYLTLLHEKKTLSLLGDGGRPIATVVCEKKCAQETVFTLPRHAIVEDASIDNLGYAIVSCLYEDAVDTPRP